MGILFIETCATCPTPNLGLDLYLKKEKITGTSAKRESFL